MDTELGLDEIEALNRARTDDYARGRHWETAGLTTPSDDIDAFLQHIPGKRMLDVGCGWARYISHFLDHDLEYIGIDNSPEMIEVARETHPDQRFEIMSYRKLQFPDASFDGLWCCCVFSGEPKRNMPSVLEELRRVLVAGGIATIILPAVDASSETLLVTDNGQPLGWYASYDLSELRQLFANTGFEILESDIHWHSGAQSIVVCN